MSRGKFITIEGIEGVGKSTNLALTESLINDLGQGVLVTREPGGTMTGERIRSILLDKDEQNMTAMTELLLMVAARRQHVDQVIEPALAAGTWVISDRFSDSSYAYQGGGRQLGMETVSALEDFVLGDFRPDLTIVLDLDVSTGLTRATSNASPDRFESEQREFFERVRKVFLDRASGDRYRVVDTSQSIEAVQSEISRIITTFYHGR